MRSVRWRYFSNAISLAPLSRYVVALFSRLQFGRCDIYRAIFTIHRAVPYSATERGDVNGFRIVRIRSDAMTPFEIEAGDAVQCSPASLEIHAEDSNPAA